MAKNVFPDKNIEFSNNFYDWNIIVINDNEIMHALELSWLLLNKMLEKEKSPMHVMKTVEQFGLVCFNKFNYVKHLYENIYLKYYGN